MGKATRPNCGFALAPYAQTVEQSRGRRYAEPAHPYRNDYERDRDRIVHSRAFRRLENKTQVFTRRHSDHFRTRLTHTLEVAQISRTAARGLGLNANLTEALALVHDIGHPPFGHVGERALDRVMRPYHGRFEHNLHALRIVEEFEQKYAAFPGLNLTFEVREGILKHSRDYDPVAYPDLAGYLLGLRPPLEAQLIDCADEIAYNCADLDDGYESRLLALNTIRDGLPLFDRLYHKAEKRWPQAQEKLLFNEALRKLADHLVTDLIQSTHARLRASRVRSAGGIRRLNSRLAAFSPGVSAENRRIKSFLQARLYHHPSIASEHQAITRRIGRLFKHYLLHPRSLPPFYSAKAQREPAQVACDYIAGMTDNFFEQQYRKVIGP
ncbi:MAG TPA: deoxyguanosinetriphosphate triphosphohydrolase [Terriglobia bacterium]|nr:deoxyguanosinetriphosphate triphosphohydrolase [Terriglobia bacterium]